MPDPDFPADAERLDLARFVTYKSAESRYFKGVSAIVEEFSCACGTVQERPRHGQTIVCTGCGLNLHIHGLHVVVWRAKQKAEA